MRIVLISLYQYGAFGARALCDVLRRDGHTVVPVYFKKDKWNEMAPPTPEEIRLLGEIVRTQNPDLIGISVRSTFFPVAKTITASFRALTGAPVIWGGPHPTICPDESIAFADMICRGEGYAAIRAVAAAIGGKRRDFLVPGVWRRAAGGVVKSEPQELLQDLDTLPLPDFDRAGDTWTIENDRAVRGDPLYNEGLTYYNFMTGLGCPFSCDFCSNSVLQKVFEGKGSFVRQRSVDHVMAELRLVKERFKKVETISCNDEVFGMRKEWLRDFCARYKREIDIPFHCDIHPAFVNEDTVSSLRDMGLQTISMGVQSGCERTRSEVYGRKTSSERLRTVARSFHDAGIFPSYDLIFDNPLESDGDLQETFEFMMSLPRPFRLNMYSLQHFPGTKLTDRLLRQRVIGPEDIDGVSLKGFTNFRIRPDDPSVSRYRRHLYKMFFLLSSFIPLSSSERNRVLAPFPRPVIRFMQGSRILRRYPWLTGWIAYEPKITFALGLIFQGKWGHFFQGLGRKLRRLR